MERVGEPVAGRVELGVGDGAAAEGRCDALGYELRVAAEEIADQEGHDRVT